MKAKRIAMIAVAGLGLVFGSEAVAGPQCHAVRGEYLLVPTTQGCSPSALACYAGQLTNAGVLNGKVFIEIRERDTELPGSIGIWAYSAQTVITTPKHGTLTYENLGFFVRDPNSTNTLQTDTALVVDGTGWFSGAAGHNSSLGFATATLSQLSGEVTGEFCFVEE